ncbi:MAG: hypothetical protein A2289_24595 [Deltaproteobacteria bacterium RIFOXYA12_FULL_58_15]|nr:MAG: hypothetical protein A2289_24595 [Deltaproteobacteria bacterium RIFOXYA12_FULL_58_15]OGR12712.1 MAG: hypothetical protein A2341_07825 [Deltaproteobacteria bacterium RIFOXYB12_FULL_58_9]
MAPILKIGEILVQQGLISVGQLGQALQAQGLHGGRLGTNLVEMGFVSEEQLATTLSRQLNLPYVDHSQVANIPPEVIAQVPRQIAEKYRAVPLKVTGKTLHVCTSDPNNLAALDELGFKLDCPIKIYLATEVALNYALEMYYGVPRERRNLTVSGTPVVDATFVQLADESTPLPAGGSSMSRTDFLNVQRTADFATGAPESAQKVDYADKLIRVNDRRQLLECIRSFLGTIWPKAVILGISHGAVVGIGGVRLDVAPERIAQLHQPIVEQSLLADLLQGRKVIHRDVIDDPMLVSVCSHVDMPTQHITIIPILDDHSVVMIAIGQGLDLARVKLGFPRALRFVAQVARVLQILKLKEEILRIEKT